MHFYVNWTVLLYNKISIIPSILTSVTLAIVKGFFSLNISQNGSFYQGQKTIYAYIKILSTNLNAEMKWKKSNKEQ